MDGAPVGSERYTRLLHVVDDMKIARPGDVSSRPPCGASKPLWPSRSGRAYAPNMRWVWRGFAALGIAALLGAAVWFVTSEIRLRQEIRHICMQFTTVDCRHHPDGEPRSTPRWNFDEGRFD